MQGVIDRVSHLVEGDDTCIRPPGEEACHLSWAAVEPPEAPLRPSLSSWCLQRPEAHLQTGSATPCAGASHESEDESPCLSSSTAPLHWSPFSAAPVSPRDSLPSGPLCHPHAHHVKLHGQACGCAGPSERAHHAEALRRVSDDSALVGAPSRRAHAWGQSQIHQHAAHNFQSEWDGELGEGRQQCTRDDSQGVDREQPAQQPAVRHWDQQHIEQHVGGQSEPFLWSGPSLEPWTLSGEAEAGCCREERTSPCSPAAQQAQLVADSMDLRWFGSSFLERVGWE